ncbi:DNA-3-methyladenine glycosylase I [Phenylobacterium montanum]|uniref:DNA-3-methyladenine glycosylase I n=1 Tax=Phenylobacterium montanum TaxID=2823693 RepID=A0A975G108_9CAUL|nr:DNA-3-methyladenine glycosylase I [Caulobacter sp. S6]QUD88804.1 DNA-3-methyladenine glycosylase I [Caulobacter sp. S6]
MKSFKTIYDRAAERKGGEAVLKSFLPLEKAHGNPATLTDDRILAQMTQRIFSAGFVWSVIEAKWPGFEEAFLGFDPPALLGQFDEFWERLCSDKRIVRNPQKIMSVRHNAGFVVELARQHGSAGRFLAEWPADDQLGLLKVLADRGSRLGGRTGFYFLRFVGRDSFIPSKDVVAALRDAGLDIADEPTSKKDMAKVQGQFNAWHDETGLPLTHISRILAMSIGDNYSPETLRERAGRDE